MVFVVWVCMSCLFVELIRMWVMILVVWLVRF